MTTGNFHNVTAMALLTTLVISPTGCKTPARVLATDGSDNDSDTESNTGGDTDTSTEYTGPVIPETCEDAALALTSVGCEFFTADLDGWEFCDDWVYAIMVSNPHLEQNAEVLLEHGNTGDIYYVTLTPLQLEVITVSCSAGCLVQPQEIERQGIALGQGFRLTSDVPILAYQWNPYGGESFATDASLLIPTSSLSGSYIAATWGSWPGLPPEPDDPPPNNTSQITLVIAEDNTTLSFTPSVDVPDMGSVGPMTAGVESAAYNLDTFDVITISPATVDGDLSGTVIQADKPVVVFGGHSCANVPNGFGYCDHVEEQLLPLESWGSSAVLAKHADRDGCIHQQAFWQIIAGADDMKVTFNPSAPPPYGSEYTLASQGELISFESVQDHYVEGILNNPPDPAKPEAPFFAYQMMTGSTYAGNLQGDPMMLQAPPAGQYLDRYVFTTDSDFDFDYDHIIVVRRAGTEVTLDCLGVIPDSEFTPVGSTDWEIARIFIDDPEDSNVCQDGPHVLTATDVVGLSVVGTSQDNSYGYLGGVGVRAINPIIE